MLKSWPVIVNVDLRLGFAEIGLKDSIVGEVSAGIKVNASFDFIVWPLTVITISDDVIYPYVTFGVIRVIDD